MSQSLADQNAKFETTHLQNIRFQKVRGFIMDLFSYDNDGQLANRAHLSTG